MQGCYRPTKSAEAWRLWVVRWATKHQTLIYVTTDHLTIIKTLF